MLIVSASKLCDPVLNIVKMEPDDGLFHLRAPPNAELSRTDLRPWASENQWYLHEAAKRARLKRRVMQRRNLGEATRLKRS